MKRISLSKKQAFFIVTCICAIFVSLCLHMLSSHLKNQLLHEKVATLWDAEGDTAHISVYFTENEKYALKQQSGELGYFLQNIYHNLMQKVTESSAQEAGVKNTNARNLIYGYYASGKVTVQYNKKKADVNAYGVGGDFFQFHPVKLLCGSYFSENDLMQDRIILDEETAWQLFGSSDVVGLFVTINEIPHMVVGVYERERGYLLDAAGNAESRIFVSHSTLEQNGVYYGLGGVEYLIPNPVTGFGLGLVQNEYLNREVSFVEHQNRFAFFPLLRIVTQIGTRSMGLSGITFPYWENIARSYEDFLASLLVIRLVLMAYVMIVAIFFVWQMWLHRKWRVAQLYEKAKDYLYEASVKRDMKKKNKKDKGESL